MKTDTTILSFDAGLLRVPRKLSGPDPQYTYAAMARGVTGEMKIKCIITVHGDVRDCHILQGLAEMDASTVRALEARHYLPAAWNDEPVEVQYLFRINAIYR